jgi:hypothetical protein
MRRAKPRLAGTRPRLHGFARCRAGVAAVEFALIAPVMLFLLLVGFDVGRFVLATERVERVAGSVSQMLAETAPSAPGSTVGYVSANDLLFFWNSAMFTFPDVLTASNAENTNWWNLLDVEMSSIKFNVTPANCTSSCTYTPKVLWSLGARACGSTITAASDTAGYSPTTLPADVFGPNSIIVVDVAYSWSPTVAAAYLPSIQIERSAYLTPRSVQTVLAVANNGVANPCP